MVGWCRSADARRAPPRTRAIREGEAARRVAAAGGGGQAGRARAHVPRDTGGQ
jgi:hypothetical protein